MKYSYCLPIQKSDKQEILASIQRNKDTYAFFEVWADYVDEFDEEFLRQLEHELPNRLVIVLRRLPPEAIRMSSQQRFAILNSLDNSTALIDLDITEQQAEITYLAEHTLRVRTIISYHNYDKTPSDTELQEILQRIRKNNPTILKIATKCQNEEDSLRLLELLLSLRKSEQKCIISGMGNAGLITRIVGALWGNALVFAPEHRTEASAPGQLAQEQLDKILTTIGE
jgi:3-dehydroquinate dehydratase-1